MAIREFTVYPQSTDPPGEFASNGDIWIKEVSTQFIPDANALATDVNAKSVTATQQAVVATTQAGIATTQAGLATTNGAAQVALAAAQVALATDQAVIASGYADDAAASAQTALLAPGTYATSATIVSITAGSKTLITQTGKLFAVGMTVKIYSTSSRSWMLGNITSYDSGTGSLVVVVTNIDGVGTYADWTISISAPMPVNIITDSSIYMLPISNRSINTILSSADKGKLISCTGTWTQTLTAADALGGLWHCHIKNAGTGSITIEPNSSELIDNLTSFVMYPGEARLIQCNGTSFYTVIKETFYHTFTVSGSFIKPPGYSKFCGFLWGAGAGGGKGVNYCLGGCGGACVPFELSASILANTESVSIGAGGLAKTIEGTLNVGGNSTFNILTAYGGTNSRGGGWLIDGMPYVTISSGTAYQATGGFGGGRMGAATSIQGYAEDSIYGGAGGGHCTSSEPGAPIGADSIYGGAGGGGGLAEGVGGTSIHGGNGGRGNSTTNGVSGTTPGGGGGGTGTGSSSGAGGNGQMKIWGVM